jgi:hypothetical protein
MSKSTKLIGFRFRFKDQGLYDSDFYDLINGEIK